MSKRLKIRNAKGEVREEIYETEDLWEWIDQKIPPVPAGQLCEHDDEHKHDEERPPATTYSWRLDDGHICYSYICEPCHSMLPEDGPDPEGYPTTESGYAVEPKHCA